MGTKHQIINGDAAIELPKLGACADLIVTSPPYDDLRAYGGHKFDFDGVADACVGALKPGGVIVWVVADATVDGSETGTSFRHALGFIDRGLRLHDTMFYENNGSPYASPNRYLQVIEYMFVFSKGAPKTANLIADRKNRWRGPNWSSTKTLRQRDGSLIKRPWKDAPKFGTRFNVWRYLTGHGFTSSDTSPATDHPARFPDALPRDHIVTWTNPGDLVIDPMAGSGTTSRAAKNLGRNSIAIEIHEVYIDTIRHKLAQEVLL